MAATARAPTATISTAPRVGVGAPRLRRHARRVARLGPIGRLPHLGRPERDARSEGGRRLAERAGARIYDRRRDDAGVRLLDERQGRDDRHVVQRDDPERGRHHRRRGPRGDRAHLRHLRLVRLLPRERHGARPGWVPGRGSRRPGRLRPLTRQPGDLPVGDRGHPGQPGSPHRRLEPLLGGAQLHARTSATRARPCSSRTGTTTGT